MLDVGGMEVHGIRGCRLVYKEVVEALKLQLKKLTSGDMRISLVVMRLGVSGLKKFMLVYTQDLFEERGEKGRCDLVCVECLWVMIG